MKIINILIILTFVFTMACTGKKPAHDHGHEQGTEAHEHPHDTDPRDHGHSHAAGEEGHSHDHDEDDHHEQEEFTMDGNAVEEVTDSAHHTHEEGSGHHDH